MKGYNSPGTDQVLAGLIQAGDNTLRPEKHKIVNYIWIKEEMPQQWKESIIAPNYKKR
jgi:hypothetical protein